MSSTIKRGAAARTRGLIIGIGTVFIVAILQLTNVLDVWLKDVPLGLMMLLNQQFWFYVLALLLILSAWAWLVRSKIKWGGA